MKLFCFIGLLLFSWLGAGAQNDTNRLSSQHSEAPIFSTNDTVTRNDYLLSIEKIFQKPKEISIDIFFHKIVMLRYRIRVMEQQINAHKILSDGHKVNLQQYITKICGTLTTFNDLFKNKENWFVG